MPGRVGKCIAVTEVERVLPVATTKEKRLQFEWAERPGDGFLMNWNRFMEPNSLFVESLDERGLAVTARWSLMQQSPEQVAVVLNRWLEQCETQTWKPSGLPGRRMQ